MTQDEIIRMAREAGWGNLVSMPHIEALERFAALVAAHRDAWWIEQDRIDERRIRAAEREACAKVCEDTLVYVGEMFGGTFAAAIRARGEK